MKPTESSERHTIDPFEPQWIREINYNSSTERKSPNPESELIRSQITTFLKSCNCIKISKKLNQRIQKQIDLKTSREDKVLKEIEKLQVDIFVASPF